MPKASATSGVQLWRWIVPIAVGIIIWFLPVPAGLNPKAIHMLGIFLGTIAAILTNPMPSGAVMMTALAVSYFSGTLTLSQSLSGLASGTVWMIFSAYVLSLGFVQSGLGRRIAYLMLSKFGGSSTGIAYSLGCADLVMAPAMPSVTARSGGIILPIAKSINDVMGSTPGESGKKIGDYLIMTCFQFTPITGALFLTGMAANPLCAHLAKEGLGVDISWGTWLWAALLPAAICFVILPHVTKFLVKPTMTKTPEAKALGKKMLGELGALTHQEKLVGVGFILALVGWATTMLTGYDANAIGLGVVAYLLISGAVKWKDVLSEKGCLGHRDLVRRHHLSRWRSHEAWLHQVDVRDGRGAACRHGLAHRLHRSRLRLHLPSLHLRYRFRPRGCHVCPVLRGGYWLRRSGSDGRGLLRYLLELYVGHHGIRRRPGPDLLRSGLLRAPALLQDQLLRGDA